MNRVLRQRAATLLFYVVAMMISCKSKEVKQPSRFESANGIRQDLDTVRRRTLDTALSSLYSKYAVMMGGDDLRRGFIDEQIRIWFEYGMSDSGKVVILQHQQGNWTSSAYYYKFVTDERDSVVNLVKRNEQSQPLSGWGVFLKAIDSLGIYRLKPYEDIQGYILCNDGNALIVEYARKNSYQIYGYPCYEEYEETFKDVESVTKVAHLIQKEFGYKLFP